MVQKGRIQENWSWLGVKILMALPLRVVPAASWQRSPWSCWHMPRVAQMVLQACLSPHPTSLLCHCQFIKSLLNPRFSSWEIRSTEQGEGRRPPGSLPVFLPCQPKSSMEFALTSIWNIWPVQNFALALVVVGGRWTWWHGFFCLKLRDKEKDN